MAFHNSVAVAIKVAGAILRENSGSVILPFGSEYSILIKNLHEVRIKAWVAIDGAEASDGWLLVGPGATLELERFIRDGNLNAGNRFRFIERSAAIEAHRGIRVDDGVVRVEFQVEEPPKECSVVWERTNPSRAMFSLDPEPPGITVPGSRSEQRFSAVPGFVVHPERHAIVLRLQGTSAGARVAEPLRVDTRLQCTSCGRSAGSSAKFCDQCGTALVLI